MRFFLILWCAVMGLESFFVCCQQDLWGGQTLSKDLMRPYFLEPSSLESPDYESAKSSPLNSFPSSRQTTGGLKKRVAAMGVDLPDYILHYRGKSPDLGSFRERMQLSGRR
ncbi:hypothetical protein X975_26192, partial [Stegodyphus mimosarum]